LNAYFFDIVVVKLSSKLLEKKLLDNYGFHGALDRFSPITLKGITQGEGIENVPEKAACFNLGTACKRAIVKYLGKLSDKEAFFIDAETARIFFLDLSPEKRARYTDAEIQSAMRVIFTSLVKKAQIRTHTAKPGEEDINKWLAGYYGFQRDFDSFIISLVDEIMTPNAELTEKYSSLFEKDDPIIALALKKDTGIEPLTIVYENKPTSICGKIF
jgi:hypothetical protein